MLPKSSVSFAKSRIPTAAPVSVFECHPRNLHRSIWSSLPFCSPNTLFTTLLYSLSTTTTLFSINNNNNFILRCFFFACTTHVREKKEEAAVEKMETADLAKMMAAASFVEMRQMTVKIASETVDSWMIAAEQHERTWGKDGTTNPKEGVHFIKIRQMVKQRSFGPDQTTRCMKPDELRIYLQLRMNLKKSLLEETEVHSCFFSANIWCHTFAQGKTLLVLYSLVIVRSVESFASHGAAVQFIYLFRLHYYALSPKDSGGSNNSHLSNSTAMMLFYLG